MNRPRRSGEHDPAFRRILSGEMPEMRGYPHNFSAEPHNSQAMPGLQGEVSGVEKEGEGMTKSGFEDFAYCCAFATILYVLCILTAGFALLFMEVLA